MTCLLKEILTILSKSHSSFPRKERRPGGRIHLQWLYTYLFSAPFSCCYAHPSPSPLSSSLSGFTLICDGQGCAESALCGVLYWRQLMFMSSSSTAQDLLGVFWFVNTFIFLLTPHCFTASQCT